MPSLWWAGLTLPFGAGFIIWAWPVVVMAARLWRGTVSSRLFSLSLRRRTVVSSAVRLGADNKVTHTGQVSYLMLNSFLHLSHSP